MFEEKYTGKKDDEIDLSHFEKEKNIRFVNPKDKKLVFDSVKDEIEKTIYVTDSFKKKVNARDKETKKILKTYNYEGKYKEKRKVLLDREIGEYKAEKKPELELVFDDNVKEELNVDYIKKIYDVKIVDVKLEELRVDNKVFKINGKDNENKLEINPKEISKRKNYPTLKATIKLKNVGNEKVKGHLMYTNNGDIYIWGYEGYEYDYKKGKFLKEIILEPGEEYETEYVFKYSRADCFRRTHILAEFELDGHEDKTPENNRFDAYLTVAPIMGGREDNRNIYLIILIILFILYLLVMIFGTINRRNRENDKDNKSNKEKLRKRINRKRINRIKMKKETLN